MADIKDQKKTLGLLRSATVYHAGLDGRTGSGMSAVGLAATETWTAEKSKGEKQETGQKDKEWQR